MEMKERIEEIFKSIAEEHPGLKNIAPTIENRGEIIGVLEKSDPELGEKLREMGNSFIAYEFIRQDKELRMKMQDVWQAQLDRTKERLIGLIDDFER